MAESKIRFLYRLVEEGCWVRLNWGVCCSE
jgi:hypothetical protein